MTDVRCEDVMDLDLGNTVTDMKGNRWVFMGWAVNTAGKVVVFAKCVDGMNFFTTEKVYFYSCTFMEALERKFPGITEMYGK